MAIDTRKIGMALSLVAVLAGCSSTTELRIEEDFPNVVFEPRDFKAAVVFDSGFRAYQARPNDQTFIDIGSAQVDLLSKAFRGLFREVEVLSARAQLGPDTDIVITPSVLEVQLSTPSDSYLNVYEVWIKYNLDIESADGEAIDSWFMPAYGKTPDSFMLSRTEAIKEATIVALRDAGAKLLLDFFRIPSVYSWMERQRDLETEP
jgi:hypothetical protein